MGEVVVNVELESAGDLALVAAGALAERDVRRLSLQIVVDTGASSLMLPQEIVDALGLPVVRTTRVQYADGRRESLLVAGPIALTVAGRSGNFDCIVGRRGVEPLLGQIVLESLDLLVDCPAQRLVPRPESPDLSLYRL